MTQASLDGISLAAALRAGIRRLLANQEHLNKINVFPVPDGDTGTNLALTLGAVLTVLRKAEAHAGNLLTRVADAAIDGARGNSGAILAQFFVGVGDRAGQLPALATRDFAEAVTGGATYAREALTEPREGTILTVITDFAAEVARLVREHTVPEFGALFARALERTRLSLEGTRTQLEAMRKANVVDAGAQGFVDLLEGMSAQLNGEVREAQTDDDNHVVVEHEAGPAAGDEIDLDHRFCTECVITGENVDRRRLREGLGELGGSVVVAGTQRKTKVHVHVDDPAAVFRLARTFGAVSAQKADDMRKQQGAAHHSARRGVAVAVDSAADIPDEELERLEIHVIPMRVHFGERSYLDKISMTQEDFYRELASNPLHPKTSQPPPGDFRRTFEFLASHFDTVVSVNVTGRVSGTRAAAESAAARVRGHGKVVVIDSMNASLGQGLVAMYAAEYAQAGYSAEEVIAATRAVIGRTHTFGLLGNLDFAVRGGRVPRIVKTVADLLHVTPILLNQRNGKVGAGTVLFGRRNLRSRFAALVRRRITDDAGYRVAVGHANAPEEGRLLLDEICAGLDNIQARYLTPLGTALGVHGGPGMLVAAIQEYEAPVPRGPAREESA
ncbi:MAG TPA: DegV family protein [Steroidobacteraceae bacterium]|nr:DegV family protein [Steroidobacteraceae bacterium]